MAMEIFKLVGNVFVDTNEAQNSLKKLDDKGTSTGKTLSTAFAGIATAAAGVATAAVAAGKAIYNSAMSSAATADNIDKMSQKMGISREAYQELGYITSQNGMSVDILQTGLKTLASQMLAASEGTKTAVGYFEELGVSINDSNGEMKSQEEMFYETIDALQKMDNETERNALAAKLFGKSATELQPLLNSGADSMAELTQKAHDLGLIMSDELVDDGVVLTDTMDSLKRSLSAVATKFGGALMPIVTKAANFLIAQLPIIQNMFNSLMPSVESLANELLPIFIELVNELLPVFSDLIAEILPPLTDVIKDVMPVLLDVIKQVLPVLSNIVKMILPVLAEVLSKILPVAAKLIETLLPPLARLLESVLAALLPLLDLLDPILDIIVALIDPLADLINYIVGPVIEAITLLVNLIMGEGESEGLGSAITWLGDIIKDVFGEAVEFLKQEFDWIIQLFKDVIQFFKDVFAGDWEAVWADVGKFFTDIWNGIVDTFKTAFGWISDIWDGIVGLFSDEEPEVDINPNANYSIRAKGGVLRRGEIGILEGTGAEAVVPLEKNTEWINKVAMNMSGALGGGEATGLLNEIQSSIKELANTGIYLDGKKLVGYLGNDIYTEQKNRTIRKARGLA